MANDEKESLHHLTSNSGRLATLDRWGVSDCSVLIRAGGAPSLGLILK